MFCAENRNCRKGSQIQRNPTPGVGVTRARERRLTYLMRVVSIKKYSCDRSLSSLSGNVDDLRRVCAVLQSLAIVKLERCREARRLVDFLRA